MNEPETRAEHIDPSLKAAAWGVVAGRRILREYLRKHAALEALRKSLLHQAFSGVL